MGTLLIQKIHRRSIVQPIKQLLMLKTLTRITRLMNMRNITNTVCIFPQNP